MKRLLTLNLLVAVLLSIGCISLGSKSKRKRIPGWSDERYKFAIEEKELNDRMREIRESENEDYMRQYGYPKYRNEYYRLPEDDRTDVEEGFADSANSR